MANKTEKLVQEPVVENVENEVVEEPKTQPKKNVTGKVINCKRLNVRKKPSKDGDVLCTIPASAVVTIDKDKSTAHYYKVTTADGVEGFCVKDYLSVKR